MSSRVTAVNTMNVAGAASAPRVRASRLRHRSPASTKKATTPRARSTPTTSIPPAIDVVAPRNIRAQYAATAATSVEISFASRCPTYQTAHSSGPGRHHGPSPPRCPGDRQLDADRRHRHEPQPAGGQGEDQPQRRRDLVTQRRPVVLAGPVQVPPDRQQRGDRDREVHEEGEEQVHLPCRVPEDRADRDRHQDRPEGDATPSELTETHVGEPDHLEREDRQCGQPGEPVGQVRAHAGGVEQHPVDAGGHQREVAVERRQEVAVVVVGVDVPVVAEEPQVPSGDRCDHAAAAPPSTGRPRASAPGPGTSRLLGPVGSRPRAHTIPVGRGPTG